MKTKLISTLCLLSAAGLQAEAIKVAEFSGDYGGNSNSALGNAPDDFHYFEEADLDGDGNTDTRRYIPLFFPYPGIGPVDPENPDGLQHGPLMSNFKFDQDLFGVNSIFYTGAQIINYSADPGVFPPFGLYRWSSGRQGFQWTSGNVAPTANMGFLVSSFVVKDFFLNAADEVSDLKLANQEAGFTAEVGFRGRSNLAAYPDSYRRARFIIRAGSKWYVSGTGTPVEESQEKEFAYSLSINPASDYWYEYDETTMRFVEEKPGTSEPMGTGVRGDSLSDISATGVILQNTRFDGAAESHAIWLEAFEYVFHLDPDPAPVVEDTWGGFPITTNEDGSRWVDTGDWMGFLNIDNAPYLFSWELQSWMFSPEPAGDGSTGAWTYLFRN